MTEFSDNYKPPFPYFGGKSRVADIVWGRLGDVDNYVEPFFGSGAVLFKRPHEPRIETINDADHMVANFWRAVQKDPKSVAFHCDNPVNEDDLTARHIWLVKYGLPEVEKHIMADPNYYDAKIAGWWCWGLCCWIGGGWCSGTGRWSEVNWELVNLRERGDGTGVGVNRKRPHLGSWRGVNRKRPHLGNAGQGVNRSTKSNLVEYFGKICNRLRNVRVCCGDWARICTNGALDCGQIKGVFLDPPYPASAGRDEAIYRVENLYVANEVEKWCLENGSRENYRIALCGYDGTHNALESAGWSVHSWSAGASYQTNAGKSSSVNSANRKREKIWFSPHCLKTDLF